MCANGDQGTLATDVLMKLVLQVNEAVINALVHADVSQHCSNCMWADCTSLREENEANEFGQNHGDINMETSSRLNTH